MRIVIAEDSVLLLDGLTRLLVAEGHEVTGYTTADEVVAALGPAVELPDLLVTDVRMPPSHTDEGLRAAVHLRSLHPRLPVLVLSQYVEQRYARELFAGDVRGLGYVLKDRVADVDEFLDALDRVAGGGTVIDPEVVAQILARTRRSGPRDPHPARARGARPHGGGPLQRGHRRPSRRRPAGRREARDLHPDQARPPAGRRRPPPRARRAALARARTRRRRP